jgi:hypothetical protein
VALTITALLGGTVAVSDHAAPAQANQSHLQNSDTLGRKVFYQKFLPIGVTSTLSQGQEAFGVWKFRAPDFHSLLWYYYGDCWEGGLRHRSFAGSFPNAKWVVIPAGCDVRVISVDRA